MEVKLTTEITEIEVKEGKDFINTSLDPDLYVEAVTSNFPFELAIEDILNLSEKDYQMLFNLTSETRNQLKKLRNEN